MKSRVLVFVLLIVFTSLAHAGTVKLEWVAPTTCADGSALSNCPTTGFETLHGTDTTGTYASVETVAGNITSRTYANLGPGQHCYSVKTVSTDQKSVESARACASVPSLPPKAPAGMSVTVVVTVTTP